MTDTPMSRPGEIAGWPKLVVTYRTDPANIAPLLPPGLTPGRPHRAGRRSTACPILGEPEYGVQHQGPGRLATASTVSTTSAWASTRKPPSSSAARSTVSPSSCATSTTSASATTWAPARSIRATRSSSIAGDVTGPGDVDRGRLHRARVVDEVLPGHRRRREGVRLRAPCRRRGHHVRADATSRSSTAS